LQTFDGRASTLSMLWNIVYDIHIKASITQPTEKCKPFSSVLSVHISFLFFPLMKQQGAGPTPIFLPLTDETKESNGYFGKKQTK